MNAIKGFSKYQPTHHIKPMFLIVLFSSVAFFNDFPLVSTSHLLRSPTSFFVFLSLFPFALHLKVKWLSGRIQTLVLLFLLSLFISAVVNALSAMDVSAEQAEGIVVLVKSLLVAILLCYCVFLVTNTVNTHKQLHACIDGIAIGCLLTVLFCLFEYFAYTLSQSRALAVVNLIEPFVHARLHDMGGKVRGLAFEPSYLGLYLSFAFPFLVYLVLTRRSKYYTFLMLFIFLTTVASQSRTGLISIFVEAVLWVYYLFRTGMVNKIQSMLGKAALVFVFLGLLYGGYKATTTIYHFNSNNISNITRVSSQVAAVGVFLDNKLFGVGYGLAGAYLTDYYPDFAWKSYTVRMWAAQRDISLSSPVFAMFPRLLAETGITGTTMFLILISHTLLTLRKRFFAKCFSQETRLLYLTLFVSIAGQMVASFGVDTLVFYGYWFSLGLAAVLIANPALVSPAGGSYLKNLEVK